MLKPKLFQNEADSDSDVEIKTSNDYATKYNLWREKEELNKLKTKYGEHATANFEISEDDSTSEDDEDAKHLKEFEKDFFKTLSSLKRKDPKIYDEKVVFFEKTIGDEPQAKPKKNKPIFMKDYERKMLLEKGAKFEETDEELEEDPRSKSPTYVEEQQRLKESFRKEIETENPEEDAWGGLFQKRQKTKEEQQQEEEDYKIWLKGKQEHLENEDMETELKSLKDYWNKPDLNKDEAFLRDYLLNKKYLEKDDENHIPTYEEIIHDSDDNLSEDENNIEKQEEFEQKYNFRYEEPDQEFIKRYPRTMDHSVRKIDDRRKVKREEIKQRKEEEKKQKTEDLKQLKILKRREIEEKIKKIKEITGNEQLAFQEMDIDGDFDPEEHDKRMQELFNDEYYGGDEGDQKPEFSDFDEELGPWKDQNEVHCEDDNFNMDCDFDPTTVKEKKHKKDKKTRNRPGKSSKDKNEDELPFDENDEKYTEYVDELYKLDYEDMIGDIPCRFKYRDVVANDFGLSVEEILIAKDKELNRWCSLKKTTQYRPEHAERYDVVAYQKKAANESLKMKYLPSLYDDIEEEVTTGNTSKTSFDSGQENENEENEENYDSNEIETKTEDENVTENVEKLQVEENIDELQVEENVEKLQVEENMNNKKTKKRKNKKKDEQKIQEVANINASQEVVNDVSPEQGKQKKKRKHSKTPRKTENENNCSKIIETNVSEMPKKKPKSNMGQVEKTIETEANEPKKISRRQKKNKKLLTKKVNKTQDETDNNIEQKEAKKRAKKKKKVNKTHEETENSNTDKKANTIEIETESKKVMKKKKVNKTQETENIKVNLQKASETNKENKKRKLSGSDITPKKKRKLNKNISMNANADKAKISDLRLQAYGINPKKYKNKLKYKNQDNMSNKKKKVQKTSL